MEDTNNTFEKRLNKYREEKGLLKKEMAKKLKVSESYYNCIENGKKGASKNFLIKLVEESKKPVEFWLYGVDVNQHTNGKFIVDHVQRDTRGNRNYVEYICNTPREVLVLVTTLKTFASPIEINNYLIYYTDGINETNYSLEDIEKAINDSVESTKIVLENEPVCKVNETYKHESSPGTPPPL